MLTMFPTMMIVEVPTTTMCLWALISSHDLLQRKKVVSRSIIESNYKVVANGAIELSWIDSFSRT